MLLTVTTFIPNEGYIFMDLHAKPIVIYIRTSVSKWPLSVHNRDQILQRFGVF